jgi:hypothetical protein
MARLYRCLILVAGLIAVTPAFALRYTPFAGAEGYQEIQVALDTYFVAFFGTRSSAAIEIEAAWRTRSAELCLANGYGNFVELGYLFEPVTREDKPLSAIDPERLDAWPVYAKGTVYVPIFIPHGHGAAAIDAPGKLGHVRCVKDSAALVHPERAIDAEKTLESAEANGWMQKSK